MPVEPRGRKRRDACKLDLVQQRSTPTPLHHAVPTDPAFCPEPQQSARSSAAARLAGHQGTTRADFDWWNHRRQPVTHFYRSKRAPASGQRAPPPKSVTVWRWAVPALRRKSAKNQPPGNKPQARSGRAGFAAYSRHPRHPSKSCVETAFISNPAEEPLLAQRRFQRCTVGMALPLRGIQGYLQPQSPQLAPQPTRSGQSRAYCERWPKPRQHSGIRWWRRASQAQADDTHLQRIEPGTAAGAGSAACFVLKQTASHIFPADHLTQLRATSEGKQRPVPCWVTRYVPSLQPGQRQLRIEPQTGLPQRSAAFHQTARRARPITGHQGAPAIPSQMSNGFGEIVI